VKLEVKDLKDVLRTIHDREGVIDLVRMDCEGCEYSLLQLDEEHIKLSKQYIVEIHGCETPLIDKMLQVGYNSKLILKLNELGKNILLHQTCQLIPSIPHTTYAEKGNVIPP